MGETPCSETLIGHSYTVGAHLVTSWRIAFHCLSQNLLLLCREGSLLWHRLVSQQQPKQAKPQGWHQIGTPRLITWYLHWDQKDWFLSDLFSPRGSLGQHGLNPTFSVTEGCRGVASLVLDSASVGSSHTGGVPLVSAQAVKRGQPDWLSHRL